MTALLPVKAVATYNDDVLPESYAEDCTIRYIEIGDVRETEGITGYTEVVFGTAPSRARRVVRSGDVLVSTVRTYLRAVAAVDEHHDGAIASTGFAVLRPRNVEPRFLRYSVLERRFMDEVEARSTGISYPAINASDLVNIKIRVPSEGEQRAIADFLDRETAQIDAFIAKNEQLITLLTERRRSEIDRAVGWGQGLATSPRWLGQVQPGWTLAPLRRWVSFITSGSRGWGQFYSESGDATFLRIGDLQRDRLELRDVTRQRITLPEGIEGTRARAQTGDLLVSITADLGSVAVIGDAEAGAYVSQHVALVRIDATRLLPRFAAYSISSSAGKSQFDQAAYGGTKIQLSLPDVKDFHLAVPPLSEQLHVVEQLDQTTLRLDESLAAARRATRLAHERRAALISAAVTGKIDVGVNV